MTSTGARLSRSRLLALLVLLISVSLCAAAVRASEGRLDYEKVVGVVDQQIDVAGGWVQVSDVRVATTLTKRDELWAKTAGMYVIVRITVAASGPRRVRFTQGSMITADRTYDVWSSLALRADPGFSNTRDVVFEVDPAQIDDLTLQLEPGSLVRQYEEHLAVHLGITAANADQWRAAGKGRTVDVDDSFQSVGLR